ncbi:aliphatic sulfonate ABC transporter periplasmic substrate-binding protein [Paucimonas lemoignei]|jgi:sulfonate transport system substrate-binding protein|nr:aliphatic sulfonate ABC transporter periplasmic substrate-binding protein [Paucimonas lemoignei]
MVALTRRQLLAGSAIAAANGLLAPLTAMAGSAKPLRVWRYKGSAASFMGLAGQLDTPYPVEWVDIGGGNLVLEALNSDSLDYVYMSEIPPIFASIANVPIALVASIPGDVSDIGIVVRNGAGIEQVADLKGKKISYVRATNTHYFLLRLLNQHGLTLKDVQPIPMPIQEALIAFRSGHLDAVIGGGISVLQAQQSGGTRLHNVSDYRGNTVIATTTQALQDPVRSAQLADFLLRERATWAWVQSNPQAWAQRNQDITGIGADLYLEQFRLRGEGQRVVPVSEQAIASEQRVADGFFEHQLIRQSVDVRPLWRNDFKHILES